MIKKISVIFLILSVFFLNSCQAPTTIVYEEGKIRKGMSRKDMSKVLRFRVLAAHNPFRGRCFHEYYPLKKKEILAGHAHILTEIDSDIEPVFYIFQLLVFCVVFCHFSIFDYLLVNILLISFFKS